MLFWFLVVALLLFFVDDERGCYSTVWVLQNVAQTAADSLSTKCNLFFVQRYDRRQTDKRVVSMRFAVLGDPATTPTELPLVMPPPPSFDFLASTFSNCRDTVKHEGEVRFVNALFMCCLQGIITNVFDKSLIVYEKIGVKTWVWGMFAPRNFPYTRFATCGKQTAIKQGGTDTKDRSSASDSGITASAITTLHHIIRRDGNISRSHSTGKLYFIW